MSPLDSTSWRDVAVLPVFGVTITVVAYLVAVRLHRWGRGHPLLNPTLIAIVILAVAIRISGLPYAAYAQSASVVSFMLSPAVVLLAVPLYRRRAVIRASGPIILGALAAGLPTGVASAVSIAWLLGADRPTLLSLVPKSTTAGIAIGISEKIGGVPALTAVLVIMTGITGAVLAPSLTRWLGVRDERALGLSMGIASHGIGTARALQIGELAGSFAGLGMSLNGVLTAILLPIVLTIF